MRENRKIMNNEINIIKKLCFRFGRIRQKKKKKKTKKKKKDKKKKKTKKNTCE